MSSNDEVVQQNCVTAFCRSLGCERIKLVLGSLVVSVLIIMVFAGIALGYAVLEVYPIINFVIMFVCLIVLATVEGLHYSVVSIEKWDMQQYAERFPRAVKCHSLVDTPDKVKKFLVGRQFFTIFVVFLLAQTTSFPGIPHNFAGLPHWLVLVVLETGLPGVAITLTVGQLISQIFVEEFTLQFMNFWFCEVMIRLSLGAEWIGVCNFSWLIYGIAARMFCGKIRRVQRDLDSQKAGEAGEEPLSPTAANRPPDYRSGVPSGENLNLFDYFKYVWSTIATLGSLVIVLYGISIEAYVLPVPVAAAFVVAICMMTVLFYLEGLMIAIVGTQYWDPETFREVYPRAFHVHRLMSQPENVKRFIIGRQFFTVLTNFLLAQTFTFVDFPSDGYNPVLFFIIVKSGLVGVLIILSFAQLLPELLAAEYPLRFMNLLGSQSIANISLVFDAIGVGHCAWAVYYITRPLCCKAQMDGDHVASDTKQVIVRVQSAEILAVTGSPVTRESPQMQSRRTQDTDVV